MGAVGRNTTPPEKSSIEGWIKAGLIVEPTHTRKGGKLYRYYVREAVLKQGRDACPVVRLPVAEIEPP